MLLVCGSTATGTGVTPRLLMAANVAGPVDHGVADLIICADSEAWSLARRWPMTGAELAGWRAVSPDRGGITVFARLTCQVILRENRGSTGTRGSWRAIWSMVPGFPRGISVSW
jgi:hypothetical protein